MKTAKIETQRRLIEAATALFAEHGFKATSIRMICKKAKVNVGAVYYHFGTKEALYHEALRNALRSVYEKYPLTYGLTADATPEDRLYAYVHSFLLRILDDECNLSFRTLIAREMLEPGRALDVIVDDSIRSLFDQLVEIVQVLVGDHADRDLVLACSRKTISQCLIYLCSRPAISRMTPDLKFVPDDIEKISDQITSFTLHALKGMAKHIGVRTRERLERR